MKNRLLLDRLFSYHIFFIFLKIVIYSFMPAFLKPALCCFVCCAKRCSGILVDFNTKAEHNTHPYKLDKSYILDDNNFLWMFNNKYFVTSKQIDTKSLKSCCPGCRRGALPMQLTDTWYMTPDTWHLIPETRHLTPDTWHLICILYMYIMYINMYFSHFKIFSVSRMLGVEVLPLASCVIFVQISIFFLVHFFCLLSKTGFIGPDTPLLAFVVHWRN